MNVLLAPLKTLDFHLTQGYCCVVLPAFDTNGNLPAGIYTVSWSLLCERFGTNKHRRWLLAGLEQGISTLSAVGCRALYIDGSFVTQKELPGDYDACYELEGMDLEMLLAAEPVFFQFGNGRAAQKAKFRGEYLPASTVEMSLQRTFLEFFQTDRETGQTKGIVHLDLRRG